MSPIGFACILFCSYPCFSFSFDACLGCHQLSAAETHTWNMDEHHTFVNAMIAWNLAIHGTHGGDPFVNFTLYSFNVKCSQKLVNLGTPFSFTILIQKLLTYCFFAGICWHSLLFLPCFVLFSWMFIWAAISYQLQECIHRIWMNMVRLSLQWLP